MSDKVEAQFKELDDYTQVQAADLDRENWELKQQLAIAKAALNVATEALNAERAKREQVEQELGNLLALAHQQQESLVTTLKIIHKISRDPAVTEICVAELGYNK